MEKHTVLTFSPVEHPDARVQRVGGANSRLVHAIDRIVRFGFAAWHDRESSLDVFLKAPGLEQRRLDRLPDWTRQTHHRLLEAHVHQIRGLEQTASKVAAMTARLDRLQRPRTIQATTPATPIRTIER